MDSNQVKVASEWNAGDMGCGELVMLLARKMQELEAEEVLCLTATDAGAKEDLPAWCGMTGNELIQAAHPQYWIKRKKG